MIQNDLNKKEKEWANGNLNMIAEIFGSHTEELDEHKGDTQIVEASLDEDELVVSGEDIVLSLIDDWHCNQDETFWEFLNGSSDIDVKPKTMYRTDATLSYYEEIEDEKVQMTNDEFIKKMDLFGWTLDWQDKDGLCFANLYVPIVKLYVSKAEGKYKLSDDAFKMELLLDEKDLINKYLGKENK